MGSAFIALADDATAASWNPGGLTQLERPEFSVVGSSSYQADSFDAFEQSNDVDTRNVPSGSSHTSGTDLNYLSLAVPLNWRSRNFILSLNYQQELSFDRDLDLQLTSTPILGNPVTSIRRFRQRGGVDAFSPALAVELLPELSIGAAVNYWFDGIGRSHAWQAKYAETNFYTDVSGSPTSDFSLFTDTFEHFRGVNATFGLLWKAFSRLQLGAVVHLPFSARFTLDRTGGNVTYGTRFEKIEHLGMQLPVSYGVGISFRPVDGFVVSADATRVEWNDFRVSDAAGREFLVSSDPADEAQVDAVTTVRAGGEYLLSLESLILAFRGGLFYDPQPSRDSPSDFYGGSAGFGVTLLNMSIDVAYLLRFGQKAAQVSEGTYLFSVPNAELDIVQHHVYLSLVYYL